MYSIEAAAKISGSLQKSSEIMKIVNSLVKLPEMQKNIHEMVQEMMKVCSWLQSKPIFNHFLFRQKLLMK